MGKEILSIPEEYLEEVIKVIELGLAMYPDVDAVVEHALTKWMNEEREYLRRIQIDNSSSGITETSLLSKDKAAKSTYIGEYRCPLSCQVNQE